MFYVYFLRSIKNPAATYVGYTTNIEERLLRHNSGGSPHTQKNRPWEIITYVAFSVEQTAIDFEKYVKVGSGHAFAKKRLW